MSNLKTDANKKSSIENLISSKMYSSPKILQNKKLRKNIAKRLRPFGIKEINPSFILSKEKLSFFQIAAFFQSEKTSWIQIHSNATKPLFRRFYPIDEILAHEMIQRFRKDLDDHSFFEEWVAYRTSKAFRKYLGCHMYLLFLWTIFTQFAALTTVFFSLFLISFFCLFPHFSSYCLESIKFTKQKKL